MCSFLFAELVFACVFVGFFFTTYRLQNDIKVGMTAQVC